MPTEDLLTSSSVFRDSVRDICLRGTRQRQTADMVESGVRLCASGRSSGTLESRGAVLEELLQPVEEDLGLQLQLFTQHGHRHLVDQKPVRDRNPLFRGAMPALLPHVPSSL